MKIDLQIASLIKMSTNPAFLTTESLCVAYIELACIVYISHTIALKHFGRIGIIYVLLETKQSRNFTTVLCPTIPHVTILMFLLIGVRGNV